MTEYTEAQEKELNNLLAQWQAKAHRLINDPYYDSVAGHMNEVQYTILCRVTNAETFRDINVHLWCGGMIQRVLADIETALKQARKEK